MSGLRERLLRHKKPSASAPQPPEAADTAELAAGPPAGEAESAARGMQAQHDPAAAVSGSEAASAGQDPESCEWAPLGGHLEHTEWGSFVLRRRFYEPSFMHGRYALNELWGQSDKLMAILLPGDVEAALEGLPHEQLLFLDTETTGLGVGAGNVPFMIGIAFYEERRFTVEQMLIRHPGEELAMLHYLEGKLRKHPYLVSYNGKTFDWPLIKNRYVLNRMPAEPDIAGHLDFLYPSRSLWKHTLPSCRLGKVEEARLHVNRLDDVPGSLAPTLYFQYLAERNVMLLGGVFEHNELDLLSLAGLAVHFSHVLSGNFRLAEMELEEQYRLGLWLSKVGVSSFAEQVLEKLISRLFDAEEELEAAIDYVLPAAQWYKQQHRYDEAVRLWNLYIERRGGGSLASLEPYLELAMYYEHREKRLELAVHYAEQAMEKAWQRQSLLRPERSGGKTGRSRRGGSEEERKQEDIVAAIQKRLIRLRGKVERSQLKPKTAKARQQVSPQGQSPGKRHKEKAEYRMDSLF